MASWRATVAGPAAILTNGLPLNAWAHKRQPTRRFNGLLDDVRIEQRRCPPRRSRTLSSAGRQHAPVAVADSYSAPRHGPRPGRPGRPRQRHRRRRRPADRRPRHDVGPRHPRAERQRRLHLHADRRLHRARQLHLSRHDGTANSNIVTVSLTVNAPARPCAAGGKFENNLLDSSTNANNGTLIGTPTYVAGRVG